MASRTSGPRSSFRRFRFLRSRPGEVISRAWCLWTTMYLYVHDLDVLSYTSSWDYLFDSLEPSDRFWCIQADLLLG